VFLFAIIVSSCFFLLLYHCHDVLAILCSVSRVHYTNPIGTNGDFLTGTIEVNDPIQFLEDICADSRCDVEIIIGKEYKKTGEYYIEIYDDYRE